MRMDTRESGSGKIREGNEEVRISCCTNANASLRFYSLSLSDVSKNPRRSVGTDFFRIDNVTESDTQVIQCNASNTHGYLFANVFISVLGSIPCHWIRLTKRATMQSNENAQ